MMSNVQEYLVYWHWSDPGVMGSDRTLSDQVQATNAERAINKVRKSIGDEYAISKRDMAIDAVMRIGKDVS